jgi:hypothetical protein
MITFCIEFLSNLEDDPHVITEHFHVISNDENHDHHFTHYVQNQIAEYLRSISCDVDVMDEIFITKIKEILC